MRYHPSESVFVKRLATSYLGAGSGGLEELKKRQLSCSLAGGRSCLSISTLGDIDTEVLAALLGGTVEQMKETLQPRPLKPRAGLIFDIYVYVNVNYHLLHE